LGHQFELFGFQKPKKKIPISKERIEEARHMLAGAGDDKAIAKFLRDLQDGLEIVERNIGRKK